MANKNMIIKSTVNGQISELYPKTKTDNVFSQGGTNLESILTTMSSTIDSVSKIIPDGKETIYSGNLNNITASESRVYASPSNMPSNLDGNVLCETSIINSNTATQKITLLSNKKDHAFNDSYPSFIRTKVSGMWNEWEKIDANGRYRIDRGANKNSSLSVDISYWVEGMYLLSVRGVESANVVHSPSLYMFYKSSNYSYPTFTPIHETDNSKISSFSISAQGTMSITYDANLYHITSVRLI